MMHPLDAVTITLESPQLLKIQNGMDWHIECHSGEIWLTQENDSEDVILRPGQGFTLSRAGVALLGAITTAELMIKKPAMHRHFVLTSPLGVWGKAYRF